MDRIYTHLYKIGHQEFLRCTLNGERALGMSLITTESGDEIYVEEYDLFPSDQIVIDFIELCHQKINKAPNCYAFAFTLQEKFPNGEILDDADHGHF